MVRYWNCYYFYYRKIHLKRYILCYCPLNYNNSLISDMFYIKLSCIFVFITNIEYVLLWYFEHNLFAAVKEIHKLRFWSTTTSADTKLLLPRPSKQWNTEHGWGSDDCGEVDIDSDVNLPASGNIMQCATVPSKCERLPWNWTWRPLYFNHWYHF